MNLDLAAFAGLRLNEHALHSWDIAVVLDPTATLPADVTSVAIDNLAMITRFVGKPIGVERSVHVRTAAPARDFQLVLAAESVSLSPLVIGDDQAAPDLVISAEAFIRLVYGRLDPNHAPQGDHSTLLDDLRRVFPGF
jgi:hypothetical protein